MANGDGLTPWQGALAVLSTCVGAGLVSLPLSMWNLGIPLSIVAQILIMTATHYSTTMYLYIKDLVPDRPESLYELGYMILGRPSIFILATINVINTIGI